MWQPHPTLPSQLCRVVKRSTVINLDMSFSGAAVQRAENQGPLTCVSRHVQRSAEYFRNVVFLRQSAVPDLHCLCSFTGVGGWSTGASRAAHTCCGCDSQFRTEFVHTPVIPHELLFPYSLLITDSATDGAHCGGPKRKQTTAERKIMKPKMTGGHAAERRLTPLPPSRPRRADVACPADVCALFRACVLGCCVRFARVTWGGGGGASTGGVLMPPADSDPPMDESGVSIARFTGHTAHDELHNAALRRGQGGVARVLGSRAAPEVYGGASPSKPASLLPALPMQHRTQHVGCSA